MNSPPLDGTTAIVTGATSGFGRAIVRRFVLAGVRVVATGRRTTLLNSLSEELQPNRILPITLDVRDEAAVFRMMEQLPANWSEIDILINNAGLARGLSSAHEANIEDWNEMVDANCKGLMYVTRAVTEGMVRRHNGHVVNIGSVAGTYPYFGGNIYGATKAFVHHFSLNLRADLVANNIRVTSVEPGAAETEFSLVRFHGDAEKAKATYEGFEPINAENVAEIVEFVVSSPQNININRVEVMARNQSFAGFNFVRDK